MRIFGLKPSRLKQWFEVLKKEKRSLGPRTVAHMLWLSLGLPFADPLRWRLRIRTCLRCPIYNRALRQCRPANGDQSLGCGCYVPFFAMSAKECWGDQQFQGEIGWQTNPNLVLRLVKKSEAL